MKSVVADTHAVLWYLTDAPELSALAGDAMDQAVLAGQTIWVSSVTVVELTYLVEKMRVPGKVLGILYKELADPASGMRCAPFDLEMATAMRQISRDVVPDMPDRMIAATALHLGLPLLTADREIRRSGVHCVW